MRSFVRMVGAISFLLALVLPVLGAKTGGQTGIETKIALEQSLEGRLKTVLTEITGSDKIIVIVNVQLMSEEKETTENPAKEEEDFILPGVPIKDAINEKKVGEAVVAALGEDTRTMIKKLDATVILDKGAAPATIKVVEEVAVGLLGIDKDRGDTFEVKYINFQRNPFHVSMLLYPPHVYWVILVVMVVIASLGGILFLYGPLQGVARDFVAGVMATAAAVKENAGAVREQSLGDTGGQSAAVLEGVSSSGAPTAPQEVFGGKEAPFSFVTAGNVKALIHLLKKEPAKTVALVVNYLSPELGGAVVSAMTDAVQKEIAALLAPVSELDPVEVDAIETKLKHRIGYLSGGSQALLGLFDNVSDTVRRVMMPSVQTAQPAVAQEINRLMVTPAMMASFDAASIQVVIRALGAAVFVQVVKTLPAEQQEKIFSTLPEGAAARLRQEMEMARPFTAERLEAEKRRLVLVIRKLQERGMIGRV